MIVATAKTTKKTSSFTTLHHHYIQGTAITSLIPSIITSAYSRRSAIIPHIPITGCVTMGAIIGSYVGSYYTIHYLNENQLRNLYMISLFVFGSRSIVGACQNLHSLGYTIRKLPSPRTLYGGTTATSATTSKALKAKIR